MLKRTVLEQGIKITSKYEGTGFDGLTGNFDNQYMSYGFLQWNLGQGTLQPLLKRLFKEFQNIADKTLPDSGMSLKLALSGGTEKQWALDRQKNNNFIDPWKTALKELGRTTEMQQIQMDAAKWYFDRAINQMGQFGIYTDRAFCLLLDIAVQNGGAPYITLKPDMPYFEKLISIVNATVSKSNPKWQGIVKDRKMAIVTGYGKVYGESVKYAFYDAGAFYDEAMGKALDVLGTRGVIKSKTYWLEYADGNIPCKGEYCGGMIMNATGAKDINAGVDILVQRGLTNSPNYWKENGVLGKTIIGQNAKSLIYRLASKDDLSNT